MNIHPSMNISECLLYMPSTTVEAEVIRACNADEIPTLADRSILSNK